MNLLDGCRRVTEASPEVALDDGAITRFASSVLAEQLDLPAWDDPGMELPSGRAAVAWLLAYNAINYCYWPEPGQPRWSTAIDGRRVGADDEALGVMTAFASAIRRGVPLDDPDWLQEMDEAVLRGLLRPADEAGELPMWAARAAALRELGQAYERHGGPAGLVASAKGSAPDLVARLVEACPSWEDRRRCGELALPLRKRAQLCVAMIAGRCGGKGPGALRDLDRLTVFADYRLPQVLRGLGVLRLSPPLVERIDRGEELAAGSPEETALRAATVWCGELLRQRLRARFAFVDALRVDHLLWRTAVALQERLPPFHRTRTTDY